MEVKRYRWQSSKVRVIARALNVQPRHIMALVGLGVFYLAAFKGWL